MINQTGSRGKPLLLLLMAAAVFFDLVDHVDFRNVDQRIACVPIAHLSVSSASVVLNFLPRFLGLSYCLKILNILKIDVALKLSFVVFFLGLMFSNTRGQLGSWKRLICWMVEPRLKSPDHP